jgi:protein-tyrosine phosphatase
MSSAVDFHNHTMPAVDDGARDDAEAAGGLAAFQEQGIMRIVATPHVQGSLTQRADRLEARLLEIDRGWSRLQSIARERYPELTVQRGAEIMLDTPDLDLTDSRLRLAGGRCALVEYPYMSVPPQSTRVLEQLVRAGVTPIIAHPERYDGVTPAGDLARAWRDAGALLQLNAGSLTGRYGPAARVNALSMLEHGLADFMCSDYHSRGRPATADARRVLHALGGSEYADLLLCVNSRLMLDGSEPLPVPPLRTRRGILARLRRWLA